MFTKEPVKVAPAAVQTLMAPRCVCVCIRSSMFPVDFVLAIITAWRFPYCHHGTKESEGIRSRKTEERWNTWRGVQVAVGELENKGTKQP